MTLTVKHAKTSAIADDPAAVAAGEVVPSDWNADHTIAGLPAGDIVGTTDAQTLTNKTLGVTVVDVNSTSDALRITQVGTGNALVVEDSTNPDATPFIVNSSGYLVTGATEAYFGQLSSPGRVQIHGTVPGALDVANWTTGAAGGRITFYHIPSGSIGDDSASNAAGNELGRIAFAPFNDNTFAFDNRTYVSGVASSATRAYLTFNAEYHLFDSAIRLGNGTSYVGLSKSGSGTQTYTIPSTDGTAGQVLTTDGSGALYWSTASGGTTGVSSITAGSGLSGGTITSAGTIALDINGLGTFVPDLTDVLPAYDTGSAGNGKATVSDLLAAGTSASSATPVSGDKVAIYDASATAIASATLGNIGALASGMGGYRSGRYYVPFGYNAGTNTFAVTANTTYYVAFLAGSQTVTITKIGVQITTGVSGATVRLGIYQLENGIPTTLLLDCGTVSAASAAVVEATISYSLAPGFYCLALIPSSSSVVLQAAATVAGLLNFHSGLTGTSGNVYITYMTEAVGSTSLPSPAGTVTTVQSTTGPMIWVRT